jgi:hypothetical protein
MSPVQCMPTPRPAVTLEFARAVIAGAVLALPEEAPAQEARAFDEPKSEAPPSRTRTHVPKRRHFDDQLLHFEVRFGFGTLVGLAGAVSALELHDRLTVGGGMGVTTGGLAFGAFARVRPIAGARRSGRLHALTIECGYSLSQLRMPAPSSWLTSWPERHSAIGSDLAQFLQFEVGWETKASSGFNLRLGLGIAGLLNPSSFRCEVVGSEPRSCGNLTVPTFTVGVGM